MKKSDLFRRLYCVDFIENDGAPNVRELLPDQFLSFDPILGTFGAANLSIEHLRWDDVVIYHELGSLPADMLGKWFDHWFDPEDKRHRENAELSEVIHSLLVEPGKLSADLGTAEPDAFWEILQLLEQAGAERIRVSSSRAEAEDADAPDVRT